MRFGWINLFGAVIVVLMLIPNIVYAVKNKDEKNLCANKFMNVIEQIGRYGCIILMWLPLPVGEFGFASSGMMVVYLLGNGALLVSYLILFALYMKNRRSGLAIAIAVIPACVFLLSGLILRHWLLAGFAVLFAAGHIYVTLKNTKKAG